MDPRADSMTAPWWRRGWSMLDRGLAELIWLHPAAAAFFSGVAVEEVVEEVMSAPRAA